DQHRDGEAGQFFQRIQFDTQELLTDRVSLERAITEVAQRFDMSVDLSYRDQVSKVAIFVSKADHCLYDLLWRHQSGELPCEISLVIGNHATLEPIARQFGIEFQCFEVGPDNKREQEARELAVLR